MIRTEVVFSSELYALCILRTDGESVLLEQEKEDSEG